MDTKTSPKITLHAVYREDQRGEHPCGYIPKELAEYWVVCKFAFWSGRRKLVLKKPEPLKLHDQSCMVSGETAFKALTSKYPEHSRALIEAWAR